MNLHDFESTGPRTHLGVPTMGMGGNAPNRHETQVPAYSVLVSGGRIPTTSGFPQTKTTSYKAEPRAMGLSGFRESNEPLCSEKGPHSIIADVRPPSPSVECVFVHTQSLSSFARKRIITSTTWMITGNRKIQRSGDAHTIASFFLRKGGLPAARKYSFRTSTAKRWTTCPAIPHQPDVIRAKVDPQQRTSATKNKNKDVIVTD